MNVKEQTSAVVEAVPGDIREQAKAKGYELRQKATVTVRYLDGRPDDPPAADDPWYVVLPRYQGEFAGQKNVWFGPFATEEEAEMRGLAEVLHNHSRAERLEDYVVQQNLPDDKWCVWSPGGPVLAGPFSNVGDALDEAERLDQERREAGRRREVRQREIRLERCRSTIPITFHEMNLDTFDAKTKTLAEALEVSRDYVEAFDISRKGLLFCGKAGSGKTSLACAVALAFAAATPSTNTKYVSITEIIGAQGNDALMSELRGPELLLLDWFGMQAPGKAKGHQDLADVVGALAARAVVPVLEARYTENFPTLLIADCELACLQRYLGPSLFAKLREKSWRIVEF